MSKENFKNKYERNSLLIGAHQSIAGGIFNAIIQAESIGCNVLQIFTKNSDQWSAKPLRYEDIDNYKTTLEKSSIKQVVAHDSYLINLCAVDKVILKKSRNAIIEEIKRCELLGINYLILHPGSHLGTGEKEGIKKIIESLDLVHDRIKNSQTKTVLETTAGQGTSIGYKFEQLREIVDGVEKSERMAVCLDTCHVFAAGYDISTEKGYLKTFEEFNNIIGLERLVVIHVNDSKRGLGSRIDRHEHIGKGMIGKGGFRFLMKDEKLQSIPKIIETPKGDGLIQDRKNLSLLHRLAVGK